MDSAGSNQFLRTVSENFENSETLKLHFFQKMGRKCCVTNCNGNYDSTSKEKTFRLPKDKDEREKWLKVIPRDNIPDLKHTVVCERHWPQGCESVQCFNAFIQNMRCTGGKRMKTLSRDTLASLSQTVNGLVELSEYLLRKELFEYVILDSFSTDPLEKEFS